MPSAGGHPDTGSRPSPRRHRLRRRHAGLVLVQLGAVLAAAVLVMSTVKAPVQAASGAVDDVVWNPGDVSYEIMDDGTCLTTQKVGVTARDHDDAARLATALMDLPRKTDFPAQTGIQDVHGNVVSPATDSNTFAVTLHAYLDGKWCEYQPGRGSSLGVSAMPGTAAELAAAPAWMKGAIAALTGAAVYVGVSLIITASITATGVLVGASATTLAAVSLLSGCIGGASSTAATLALTGAGSGWKSNLANAVTGCITGATMGVLSLAQRGAAIGNAIRQAFGYAPVQTLGTAGVEAAIASDALLEGLVETHLTAADAAIAVL